MINQNILAAGKMLFALLVCLSVSLRPASAQNLVQRAVHSEVNYAIGGYYECLPLDYAASTKKYPLLIFIHGIGELGDGSATQLPRILKLGPPRLINRGLFPNTFTVNGKTSSFIVVSPQFRANYRDAAAVSSLIDYCVAKYRVDESRIYLTGLSMGGGISWIYAGKKEEYAKRLAGLLVVCGNTNASSGGATNMVSAGLPVWATHNDGDPVVSVNNSLNWEKGLNGHSPAITPKMTLNIFHSDSHDAWTKTYDPAFKPNGLNVYEWLLSNKRSTTTTPEVSPNVAPVVNAGPDQTLTLPNDLVMLNGSAKDADGTIASYNWTKVSGPDAGGEITYPENNVTMALGLVQGTYTFRLTAKDNDGAAASDDVKITVTAMENRLPLAHAGADITLTLPENTTTLTGAGSDADGTIAAFKWTKISGPASGILATAAAASTVVSNLEKGTYVYQLQVTDNSGGEATDEVKIVVNAEVPVLVKAGADTLIYKNQTRPDSIFLRGSTSANATQYAWTKISGPGSATIANASAAQTFAVGLQEGVHTFRLTVNGKASDEVQVVVRDWQKKNSSPCRAGGGKAFIVPESAPGQYNYLYINRDNRLGEKVLGGDTLYFKGGTFTAFELGDFGGSEGCPVYVMPKDKAVVITDGYFRIGVKDSNVVQHVVLDGTALRSKGIAYGFFIDNRKTPDAENNYAGLVAKWVSNFTVKGYRSIKTGIFQIKIDAQADAFGRYDKFVQKRIKIQDNFIDGSTAEGLYIGHTASNGGQLDNPYGPPPRMDSVEITDNIITNCAWDGIQLANARTAALIRHNLVYKTGVVNQASQRAGILLGANTSGSIDSNLIVNSKGNGIQVFGYGAVKVHANIVDSIFGGNGDQDGIYQSHLAVTPETYNIPLSVNNAENLIGRVERKAIRIANNSGTMIPGHTYSNTFINAVETDAANLINANAGDLVEKNKLVANFPFQINTLSTKDGAAFIQLTQDRDTEQFATVKEAVDWLFGRLGGVTAANEKPVANAGADKLITLPVDSVVVKGTGADVDGSIVAYAWKQLSGPHPAIIKTESAAAATISSLVAGTYSFQFSVTDNGKATAADTLKITVKPAPVPVENSVPDVFAGTNQRITLPLNVVTLKGSATDEDGSITATKWTKVSGPAGGTLRSENSLQTNAENLVEGTYYFALSATDNKQATAWDTVKVTVVAAVVVMPPNKAPIANAGTDQSLQLPLNTTQLNGSGTDEDGTIENYRWIKISGPAGIAIKNSNTAVATLNNLQQGEYLWELTVTDNIGATDADTVKLTVLAKVNTPPVADAGTDQTIELPVNTIVLNGNGADEDGTIENLSWKQLSGPAIPNFHGATTSQTQLRNLKEGAYVFVLTVTDNNGATASDTVHLIVKPAPIVANKIPIAYAGVDFTVQLPQNTAVLSGSGIDEDGIIRTYHWSQVSGPSTTTLTSIHQPQGLITDLVAGTYLIELKVTDDAGASATDTVAILVKAAPVTVPNKAPFVNAGSDITVTLPATKTVARGVAFDLDGTVVSYQWTKISGPINCTITTPQALQTEISNLAKGTYTFELMASDNEGAEAKDTVQVTVQTVITRPMFVLDAGADVIINLPTDSVWLESVVDDPYETITRFDWKKVSGPKSHAFSPANAAKTLVSSLVKGVYQFECKATDEHGNILTDTVQVTVNVLTKSSASLYPNPSTGMLNLKIEANTRAMNTKVAVYDVMGRVMYQEDFMRTGGSIIKQINLTKVPAGIYTVEVVTDINTKTSMKWVKY